MISALDQSITTSLSRSVDLVGRTPTEYAHLLSDDALQFLALLARQFRSQIAGVPGTSGRTDSSVTMSPTWANNGRAMHLVETSVEVDGMPMSAGLFDFGLFAFHMAPDVIARRSQPIFYLPKLENRLDARLWSQVFLAAHDALGIPRGSIRPIVRTESASKSSDMAER